MRRLFFGLLALILAACASPPPAATPPAAPLPTATTADAAAGTTPTPLKRDDLIGRPAPELHDGAWLNTPAPLRLADLRGQVVLLHFWSYDCLACQHIVPHVNRWHAAYGPEGLVVIGDHFPTFNYERTLDNLTAGLARQQISYPVIQDNDALTVHQSYMACWGSLVLIDKQGIVRYRYDAAFEPPDDTRGIDETEPLIRTLLAEAAS
jgi:thiol-disulfide isomerase/thioredoxin